MKAMIFAAGLGTRLRPLTDSKPKALVEAGGVAMLSRVISHLAGAGVNDITVNIHHHAAMIREYIESHPVAGITFHISDESDMLLDTGGGILKARCYLDGDEPFIVYNADILSDVNVAAMVEYHQKSGATATLLVKERESSRRLLIDNNSGRMRGWTNIKTGEIKPSGVVADGCRWRAFGGIHVLSPAIFPELEKYATEAKFSIMPFYIDRCNLLDIRAYEPAEDYMWHDIGSLQNLKAAEEALAKCNK